MPMKIYWVLSVWDLGKKLLHLHLLCRDLLSRNAVRMSHVWTMLQPENAGIFLRWGCSEWPWIAAVLGVHFENRATSVSFADIQRERRKKNGREDWEDWITRTAYEKSTSKSVSRPRPPEHAVIPSPYTPVMHQDCKTEGPGHAGIEPTYSYRCSPLLRVLCVVLCFLQTVWEDLTNLHKEWLTNCLFPGEDFPGALHGSVFVKEGANGVGRSKRVNISFTSEDVACQ